jgi:antitoxin HicB
VTLLYPLHFEHDDNGTLLVTCPVLPEVTTFGEGKPDAWAHGREAVEEALGARIARWQDIPVPGRDELEPALKRGEAVALSLLANLKVQLFLACQQAGVSRADLVRALGWHREQVDRLFRFDHSTRPDQFDAAFAAIGKAISIEVEDIGRAAA